MKVEKNERKNKMQFGNNHINIEKKNKTNNKTKKINITFF